MLSEEARLEINLDRGLSPQVFGCPHVKQLLASASKDIAIRSYKQACRVAFQLRHRDHDISAFEVRRCRTCCDLLTSTFLCLQCPFVGCRRLRHGEAHHSDSGHMFGVDSRTAHMYCFVCRDYIFNHLLENIRINTERLVIKRAALNKNGVKKDAITKEDAALVEMNAKMPPCRAQSGLRGFQNMGATCFMSVILQSFIHNPIIRNDFLCGGHNSKTCTRENCLSCCIDEIFTEFFSSPSTTGFGPANLLTTAWKTQKSLAGYSEQDAHEFLQFVVDQLHRTSDRQALSQQSDYCGCIVHRTFCGQLQSDIICPNCNNVTVTVDPLMDLSLELRDRKSANASRILSLQECLEKFTSPERLETKYNCSFCSTRQEVTKQLKIKRLPLVLSIQLKRFEHSLKSNKIDDHVPFPVEIDMTPYTTRERSKKRYTYELLGVVCHQGKINTGHYTCSMKNREGLWFNFDDAMVTLSSEKQVLASRAYLLFYIVKDLATSDSITPSNGY
ncbi:hypothetical protein BZA70DRAFT_270573 [Myxozyma melibiosi]|uniref:Ubiquitin carboxyl-terminal hydrolase n=1 Tax=Myxozyma melibiosi TaxID=54550 RepID=A0ABR1FBB2_9ASCO